MRYGNVMPRFTLDAELKLKDAGLVAASAAAQVDGSNQILDIGEGNWLGAIVIDATAVEVASGDEKYEICAQLSSSATFASDIVETAVLPLGDAAVLGGDVDLGVGRYVLYVHNNQGGSTYRYLRLYTRVTGTIATGINYSAFAAKC